LELDACRYDGASVRSPVVRRLAAHVDLLPVCPEVAVGLGVPRDPIRLVRSRGGTALIQPTTGRDLTELMHDFASRYLMELPEVEGFLLKARSPSCGIHGVKVFPGAGAALPVWRDAGKFAAQVLGRFPDHPVEHERRLTNTRLWDDFLTRLFALAGVRSARDQDGSATVLAGLHSRHHLTQMMFLSQDKKTLDQIVGESTTNAMEAWRAYTEVFRRAWARAPRAAGHRNVIQYVTRHIGEQLSPADGRHLDCLCDGFHSGHTPRSALVECLRGLVLSCGLDRLAEQAYLNPYPADLGQAAD
jgi:uncharacterized protein YbbK (DUF523 family)/uncharacterized protein YbgA (DUF1722 family)